METEFLEFCFFVGQGTGIIQLQQQTTPTNTINLTLCSSIQIYPSKSLVLISALQKYRTSWKMSFIDDLSKELFCDTWYTRTGDPYQLSTTLGHSVGNGLTRSGTAKLILSQKSHFQLWFEINDQQTDCWSNSVWSWDVARNI